MINCLGKTLYTMTGAVGAKMSCYSIGVYLWRAHGGTRFRQTHVATRLDWILRSNVIEAHKSFKNCKVQRLEWYF
jgi:hypothetical protein